MLNEKIINEVIDGTYYLWFYKMLEKMSVQNMKIKDKNLLYSYRENFAFHVKNIFPKHIFNDIFNIETDKYSGKYLIKKFNELIYKNYTKNNVNEINKIIYNKLDEISKNLCESEINMFNITLRNSKPLNETVN